MIEEETTNPPTTHATTHPSTHSPTHPPTHPLHRAKDLAPIVAAFNASEEKATRTPSDAMRRALASPRLQQEMHTTVPPPFSLQGWLERRDNAAALESGASLDLFAAHPDREFSVRVVGGASEQRSQSWRHESWLLQLRGEAVVRTAGGTVTLGEGACTVVPAEQEYSVERPAGSRGLVVTNDPLGNRRPEGGHS